MKKLMCLITVLTLVMSVSMVSNASDNSPSDEDFKVSVDHSGAIYVNIYTQSYEVVYRRYVSNGESVNVTAPFGDMLMLSAEYDFTSSLEPYFSLISSATNVWVSYASEYYQYIDPAVDDAYSMIWCNYDNGKGFQQFKLDEYDISGMGGVYDGNHVTSPIDIADVFRGGNAFNYLQIAQRINIPTNSSKMYDYQFIPRAFSLIVYLQGVSGTDANMFLVVDGGLKNVDASIQQVKNEVKVMQGQLDNIDNSINQGFGQMGDKLENVQGSINQGFDGVLKPNASDKNQSDKFGSSMSDKVEQGGSVLDQIGQMQKPDIDSVMPDDLLSDKEADAMITLMDTVQPVLASALIGRTLLIGLILALIAFIFYGKR